MTTTATEGPMTTTTTEGPMTTTTTTTAATYAPVLDPGELLPANRLTWDRDDWLDELQGLVGVAYASSVIRASDDACLLPLCDLERLLEHHGTELEELRADLGAQLNAGHEVLPLRHAGQALIWLGY